MMDVPHGVSTGYTKIQTDDGSVTCRVTRSLDFRAALGRKLKNSYGVIAGV
jgi:hypothetical protein